MIEKKKAPISKPKSIMTLPVKPVNFSVRLPESDATRVQEIAAAKEWTLAKTLQKLVSLALEKELLK